MGIFEQTAPMYWDNGLPVIPLQPREKRPCILKWSTYSNEMPSEESRETWLNNYSDGNIGLPLGKQSGLVMLDIDYADDSTIDLIEKIAPKSPWTRIGAKGKVIAFKFNGEKSWQIKARSGEVICEMLSTSRQVVLPPSIHPTTKKAYTANTELLTVLDEIPALPKDFEQRLREAISTHLGEPLDVSGHSKMVDYIPAGNRDTKMTSMAGIFAQSVLRGEITLYEAIDRMLTWGEEFTQNVVGDPLNINAGISNIIKFMMNDVNGPRQRLLPKNWDQGLTDEDKKDLHLDEYIDSDENVQLDPEEIKLELKAAFMEYAAGSAERNNAIKAALKMIARDKDMSSIDREGILKFILTACRDVSMRSLREQILEYQTGGLEGNSHTEIAEAVLTQLEESVMYSERGYKAEGDYDSIRFYNDVFWRWNGSCWELLETKDLLKSISTNFGDLPAAKKSNDHIGILNVMKNYPTRYLKTEKARCGVNLANGFVQEDGTIVRHSKNHGCTYTLPYSYDPDAPNDLDSCPLFKQFLTTAWGHEPDFAERVACLRDALTVTLFGKGPSFERCFLLYGLGGTGKTQLMNLVQSLLPAGVISVLPPHRFNDKFSTIVLSKSLLNVCGEMPEDADIKGDMFKSIIDGHMMEGQYKGGQIFAFRPQCTHWFVGNHLPHSKDVTEGFYRRWCVLSFNRIIREDEKIRDFGERIVIEERENIAGWVISNIKELSEKSDITIPPSHYKCMKSVMAENDTLFFFMTSEDKGPRLKQDSCLRIDKLYNAYQSFCSEVANVRPVARVKFSKRLQELAPLMNFSVTDSEVVGITMEKGTGSALTYR